MYFGKLPIWTDHIVDVHNDFVPTWQYKKGPAELLNAQSKLRQLVKEHIDDNVVFKELMDKKRLKLNMTQPEEICWLIFSMLLLDPKARITIEKARIEIRKILISHPLRRRVKRTKVSQRPQQHELFLNRLRSSSSAEPFRRLEALMQKLRRSDEKKEEKKEEKPTPKASSALPNLFQKLALDEV